MSVYDQQGQMNPDLPVDPEYRPRAERIVRALEDNKAAVSSWFWKAFLAFNLILWSLVLSIAFLMRVG